VSGRHEWLNRDPLGEAGGINLYGFVANFSTGSIDIWGYCKDVPFLFVHYRESQYGLGPGLGDIRGLPKVIHNIIATMENLAKIGDLIGDEKHTEVRYKFVCDDAILKDRTTSFGGIDSAGIGGSLTDWLNLIYVFVDWHTVETWTWENPKDCDCNCNQP
jgi:hypothetical protein